MSASHYSKTLLFIYLLFIFIFKFLKTTVQQKQTNKQKQTKTERKKNTHGKSYKKDGERNKIHVTYVNISGLQKGP